MPSLEWLKHAFAVDTSGPFVPTVEQGKIVDRLCREIVRRRLTTPAVLYLEMSRPLGFLAAQAIHFFTPLIAALTDAQGYRHFAEMLEQRKSVDYILERLEAIDREVWSQERPETEDVRSES